MKKKGLLLIFISVILAATISLGGCFALLTSVLDNLDSVFSLLDPSVNEGNLPEGTVYGSANPLAVGFDEGDLYAYWDDQGEEDYTLSVTKNGATTEYDPVDDGALFSDTAFDLAGAGYTYSDELTVKLTRITINPDYDSGEEDSEPYLYSEDVCNYEGLTATEYRTYVKSVPGGFTTIDYYIASRYELFEFFAYLIIFRPDAKTGKDRSGSYYEVEKDIKMGYDFVGSYEDGVGVSGAYEAEIKCAVASFEDSAAYSYDYSINQNMVGNIYLKFSYSTVPKYTTDTSSEYKNDTSRTEPAHYRETSGNVRNCLQTGESSESKATSLDTHFYPIDRREKVVKVSSSDQLYFAIKKGYQPDPVVGSNAYYLYRQMRLILSRINKESYSDLKKIHMIYDYLVNTVIYDYDFTQNVIDKVTGADLFLYKCLYMEGVFGMTNSKSFDATQCVAICDGLSKAFLCMAEIEGISAVKVSGTAMTAYGQERGAHAWNKAQIDGKWYMVDTTWGNQLSSSSSSSGRGWLFPFYTGETNSSSSGKQSEYLSHDYCLVPDDSKHDEDKWFAYPTANTAQPRLV